MGNPLGHFLQNNRKKGWFPWGCICGGGEHIEALIPGFNTNRIENIVDMKVVAGFRI